MTKEDTLLLLKVKAIRIDAVYSLQLKLFIKVAELGSFSRAATEQYVTPAAIMKQMNQFETRLGLKLLHRTNHGVHLTEEGKIIYESGKHLISEAEKALLHAKAISRQQEKCIRVGSSTLRPGKALVDLWSTLFPDVQEYRFRIVPFADDYEHILTVIASLGHKMDFMIGSFNAPPMHRNADYLVLGNNRLCVAFPKDHPLAGRETIALGELHGEHLIMVQKGLSDPMDGFHELLAREHPGIMIEYTTSYYDVETFNACEETGYPLLTLDAWAEIHPSLITIPIRETLPVPYGLLYSKKLSGEPAVFLEKLKRELQLHPIISQGAAANGTLPTSKTSGPR